MTDALVEEMAKAMRDSEPGMEHRSWRYWLPNARAALQVVAAHLSAASGIETRRAETAQTGSVHESPVATPDAQPLPGDH